MIKSVILLCLSIFSWSNKVYASASNRSEWDVVFSFIEILFFYVGILILLGILGKLLYFMFDLLEKKMLLNKRSRLISEKSLLGNKYKDTNNIIYKKELQRINMFIDNVQKQINNIEEKRYSKKSFPYNKNSEIRSILIKNENYRDI